MTILLPAITLLLLSCLNCSKIFTVILKNSEIFEPRSAKLWLPSPATVDRTIAKTIRHI
jgi:hypothetical protein